MTRSDGLTKVILQGTVEGRRRRGRPKKSWIDNIAEWTGKSFAETQAMAHDRQEWRYEEVRHDAPLRLLAELRGQDKTNTDRFFLLQNFTFYSSSFFCKILLLYSSFESNYFYFYSRSLQNKLLASTLLVTRPAVGIRYWSWIKRCHGHLTGAG